MAALALLDRGTLLPDMVDRVCGKGDIDTAAIRSYSSGLAASSLKEWGASCESTRQDCTRPASSKVYKDIGKDS